MVEMEVEDMVGALAMELPGLFQSAHMGQFTLAHSCAIFLFYLVGEI